MKCHLCDSYQLLYDASTQTSWQYVIYITDTRACPVSMSPRYTMKTPERNHSEFFSIESACYINTCTKTSRDIRERKRVSATSKHPVSRSSELPNQDRKDSPFPQLLEPCERSGDEVPRDAHRSLSPRIGVTHCPHVTHPPSSHDRRPQNESKRMSRQSRGCLRDARCGVRATSYDFLPLDPRLARLSFAYSSCVDEGYT